MIYRSPGSAHGPDHPRTLRIFEWRNEPDPRVDVKRRPQAPPLVPDPALREYAAPMSRQENVPLPAVRRLSLYLRQLEIIQATDRQTVSSKQLGAALGISDAQIRKDLAYFGQFGHPGIGYRVPEMIARLRRILGTDRKSNVLVNGAGNLGRALLSYKGFANKGFEIVAVFDNNPAIIGTRVGPQDALQIRHSDEMKAAVRQMNIRLGILAVPGATAQAAADQMIDAGVRAILSFAPCTIQVPMSVAVSSVDLSVQLEQLAFQLGTVTG